MHGNDAVLLLADGAAMLPLNVGRFDSFFDETRFVDNANGVHCSMFVGGMVLGNDFLEFVA